MFFLSVSKFTGFTICNGSILSPSNFDADCVFKCCVFIHLFSMRLTFMTLNTKFFFEKNIASCTVCDRISKGLSFFLVWKKWVSYFEYQMLEMQSTVHGWFFVIIVLLSECLFIGIARLLCKSMRWINNNERSTHFDMMK